MHTLDLFTDILIIFQLAKVKLLFAQVHLQCGGLLSGELGKFLLAWTRSKPELCDKKIYDYLYIKTKKIITINRKTTLT